MIKKVEFVVIKNIQVLRKLITYESIKYREA